MNAPGHHPDAKDFVAVNSKGVPYRPIYLLYHMLYRLNVTDTFAWEKEIFSPFDGIVRTIENNMNDRASLNLFRDLFNGLLLAPRKKNKGVEEFLGNYIVIESSEGVFALLAHLKKGSVIVSEGQHIHTGEVIAQIGNSGNTIQPHLHFQLMWENDPAKAIPVPFQLNSYQINKSGEWKEKNSELPCNYEPFKV